MLYLLDANVLIRAHEDYYGIEQVPQFWVWLHAVTDLGFAQMPLEIYDEIAVSTGPLHDWITQPNVKDALLLNEEVDRKLLQKVLDKGYGLDLTEVELEHIGRDPFLIAYALAQPDRVVVTKEVSASSKKRANRRIPDVCNDLGVKWMKDFDFYKAAGFNTK